MAKTIIILKSIFISYIALISLVSKCKSLTETSTNGFTTDLIHSDSPQSPSHDPSLSPSQRLANALRRSINRAQRFSVHRSRQSPKSENIIYSNGEYLMKYSIGNPPVPSLGIVDTSRDIAWTQCQPCLQCFDQNLPLFNPNSSSTYKSIHCNTSECNSVQGTFCSRTRQNCLYYEIFVDQSFTQGLLSTDTFTFGERVSVPNVLFECGFRNAVSFGSGGSGIVGLGGGNFSLIRQLGPLAQGKFSYCLVPLSNNSKSSKLNFGAKGEVSGRGVVSTPFVRKYPDSYYYLTLKGISVGKQKLEFYDNSSSSSNQEGNIIIDSGITLTLLPTNLYDKLKKALQRAIKMNQIKDPKGVLDLCFVTPQDIQGPDITFHFEGANVKLKSENMFVRTSNIAVCLAVQPVGVIFPVYGSIAQSNFLVGYDLEKRTVSFKATDCGN